MLDYFISPRDLWNSIATSAAPQIIDVRRADVFAQSPQMLPGALWRDAGKAWQWSDELDVTQPVVVACKAGHELSQTAAAHLRADGFDAQVLAGGYEGWGGAAAAEERPHPLSMADPALPRSAGARAVRRSGRGRGRRARERWCALRHQGCRAESRGRALHLRHPVEA